ncbi:piggyBac transposable element-derived protein 4-like [Physella acuta]|uniref:piggyBac transposable element-derived protein 4-like n=1 Tax=Physella acuta TaxID=109671 RepID=UPI0027DD9DEA|nr:piggyBac transposable element-derived protein 4-like [Physella acuta]
MADSGAGSSKPRTNLFDLFLNEESDSEDDFNIPHVNYDSSSSDDSDSCSEDEVIEDHETHQLSVADKFGWQTIDIEPNRLRTDPVFTVRNPLSSKNIDLAECTDPVHFFSLLFDDEVMNTLLKETNRYAQQFLSTEAVREWIARHPSSRYNKWPINGITMDQLKKYLGLLLNMGVVAKKKISDYWSTRPTLSTPFFNDTMNCNMFFLIHRMLHLNNLETEKKRGEDNFDPWSKIRPFLDKVNTMSKKYYIPSKNISIDESMIGMKNRCVYIQYMPNKRHARFGIKKFQLCDSNGFIMHIELYGGKDFDVRHDEGQAFAVVRHLMEESKLLNKGYHLYTDNFYTKPALAEFLLEKKTLLTGTVRANSRNIPENKSARLQIGEASFWRKGEMLFLSFREKKSQTKPVYVLSILLTMQS